jgi:two-component system sensor histidine kinase ChiS
MGKIIMVVDDEPDTIELTKTVLEMNGFKVLAFTDSQEALNALKKDPLPDLIALDMRMPQVSGPDFCKKVRSDPRTKNLKIVFFTASSGRDNEAVEKYGALGYIFKPFDNDQLIKDINKYLGK